MGESDLSLLNSLVSATGWTLVHFLWQGCIIAAFYWIVCAFSRPESAQLRYWAGLSSYLLALGTLFTTFAICHEPAAEFSSQPLQPQAVNSFIVLSGGRPDMWSFLQAGIEPALPIVVLVWIIGVLFLSVRTGIGWYGTRRWSRQRVTPVGDDLQRTVERLIERLEVSRAVTVLQSTLVRVPMVIGWFKPVILLPAGVIAGLPRNQLEMVIAHELGHIRRNDYLVNLLQIVLETLLFYHPAIRWMGQRVRAERELCCDDLVVTSCGKPVVYAKALASLETLRGPAQATAMAATGGDLLCRVRRIVDTELPRNGSGYAQVSMMTVVALVVALSAQQGLQLSRALTDIAESVRLQTSDVELITRSRSREAWAEGVGQLARDGSFYQPPEPEVQTAEIEARAVAPVEVEPAAQYVETQSISEISERDTEAFAVNAGPEPMPLFAYQAWTQDEQNRNQGPMLLAGPNPIDSGHNAVPSGTDISEKAATTAPMASIKPVKTAQPRYPWRARNKGQEGFVKLTFSVDSKGKVHAIEVKESWPEEIFDRAAVKALKKWKFEATANGAEPVRLSQTFDFKLETELRARTNHRKCASTGRRTCTRTAKDAVIVYVNPPSKKKASS
jgi:TonB family protein